MFYHADVAKGEGPALAKKFKIAVTPTFVVLNTAEQTIDRWTGYAKPITFADKLAATLASSTTLEQREAAFAANPTEAAAADLGRVSASQGEYVSAVKFYRQAQKLGSDPEQYAGDIFEHLSSGYRDTLFTFDELKASADEVLAARKRVPDNVVMVGYMMAQLCRQAGNPEAAAPYITAAVEDTAQLSEPGLARYRRDLRVDHALIVLKDPAKAVQMKKAAQSDGWLTDPQKLNSFAWWCFENHLDLAEADSLGRVALDLAKERGDKAMIADTVAEICSARGNAAEAVKFSETAQQNDPENPQYKKQVERFTKELAGTGNRGQQ